MTTPLEELARLAAVAPDGGAGDGDSDGLIRRLLAVLQEISGLDSVFLARVDPARDTNELAYVHNAEAVRHPVPEGHVVPWSLSPCRFALAEKRAVTHTARDQWPELEVVDDLSITTYAVEPIRDAAGAVVGTLCAISDRRRPVSPVTREAMKRIAGLLATPLGGSRAATTAGAMDRLALPAMQDDMTGLPTRAALREALAAALARGGRVALASVDLVGFEELDAREGHWGADQFLHAVSERLRDAVAGGPGSEPGSVLAPEATLARLGDREFVLLVRLPASSDGEAAWLAALRDRLADATRGSYAVAWAPVDYPGAVVETVVGAAGEDADALLHRAEERMVAGRGR